MWRVIAPNLLSLGLLGCSARDALPTLSVRAMTVLHDRADTSALDTRPRRTDFAVSVQLGFQAAARNDSRGVLALEARDPLFSAEPFSCSDAALCAWADTAEQSLLAALGVPP